MIQPLSLDCAIGRMFVTEHTKTHLDNAGDEVVAQVFRYASGARKGIVAAYLRTVQDEFSTDSLWFVSSRDGKHIGMFENEESALYGVMAEAYRETARMMDAQASMIRNFREQIAELEAFEDDGAVILRWENGLCVTNATQALQPHACRSDRATPAHTFRGPVFNGHNEQAQPISRAEAIALDLAELRQSIANVQAL